MVHIVIWGESVFFTAQDGTEKVAFSLVTGSCLARSATMTGESKPPAEPPVEDTSVEDAPKATNAELMEKIHLVGKLGCYS